MKLSDTVLRKETSKIIIDLVDTAIRLAKTVDGLVIDDFVHIVNALTEIADTEEAMVYTSLFCRSENTACTNISRNVHNKVMDDADIFGGFKGYKKSASVYRCIKDTFAKIKSEHTMLGISRPSITRYGLLGEIYFRAVVRATSDEHHLGINYRGPMLPKFTNQYIEQLKTCIGKSYGCDKRYCDSMIVIPTDSILRQTAEEVITDYTNEGFQFSQLFYDAMRLYEEDV